MDNFNCAICKEFLCNPVTLTCQHNFCNICLENWYFSCKDNHDTPKCPLCNQYFMIMPNINLSFKDALLTINKTLYTKREKKIKEKILQQKTNRKLRKKVLNDIWKIYHDSEDNFYSNNYERRVINTQPIAPPLDFKPQDLLKLILIIMFIIFIFCIIVIFGIKVGLYITSYINSGNSIEIKI